MARPHTSLSELLAERRLDRIRPSKTQAKGLLEAAGRHVESAKKVGKSDHMRQVRNLAEYDTIDVPLREAAWLVIHAVAVVPAIEAAIKT